ncbi:MAG TPA: hypothetical protein VMH04_16980 [Candidatus Solibacter sp.]|nr:hypothetical protein [Candidatus Solibacter sp.]
MTETPNFTTDFAVENQNDRQNDDQPAKSVRTMARVALSLSFFAFIIPIGVAAIVVAHMAKRRLEWGDGREMDDAMVRAASWIAYIQLALALFITIFFWSLFQTAIGLGRDPMVRQAMHPVDINRTLDPAGARDAEQTALTQVNQLIAIEEQYRRHREHGDYACRIDQLIFMGPETASAAQKQQFGIQLYESPYMFRLSNCNPVSRGMTSAAFVLTAVPHPVRMPEKSLIYCADQTGLVREVRGGTSLDCLQNGEPAQ